MMTPTRALFRDLNLSEAHFDALKEICNIGMGHAATALNRMIGKTIHLTVPEAGLAPFDQVPEFIGGADRLVTAVYFQIVGEVQGNIFFIFPSESTRNLCRLLTGAAPEDDFALTEMHSSALMEIARAASRLSPRPRRTLVFVFFGGEEMGLLGSKFFAANTPKSLGKCVGVFNLDMVGAGSGAYVSGGKNFPNLMGALEKARDRREPGMKLLAGLSSGEPRADHGPFQKAGLPAVSLFGSGGSHHGYHTADDTIFFITPKTMEAVGRVVFDAAVTLANEKK